MAHRFALALCLAVGAPSLLRAAPAVAIQSQQPDIPNIPVTQPDGSQMLLLGIFAFGDQVAIDRLAAATTTAGLRGDDVETEGAEKEYGVIFRARTSREEAFAFIARAEGGEFGRLRVEYVLVPPDAVRRARR